MSEPTPAEITAGIERHESEIARRYVEAARCVLDDARDDMIAFGTSCLMVDVDGKTTRLPPSAWSDLPGNMDWVRA